MKRYLFTLIFILMSPLTAFAQVPIYTDANQPIMQSANQPEFIIQLKSNPTTGYSWFLKHYDLHYIKVLQHHYIPPKTMLAGAGGIEEWKFRLTPAALAAPHRLSIELVYVRPWETETVSKATVFHIVTQ